METPLAIGAGVLVAGGVWLMLSGHLLRFLMGLLLFSNGVNMAILTAGRLTSGLPPLLDDSGALAAVQVANALPQALLLTAIVIGFGLFAFALALTIRAWRSFGHLDIGRMRLSEPDHDLHAEDAK